MQLFIYKSTEQAKVSPAISKEYSPTFQTIATAFIFLWNKNNKNMLKIIKPVEPYSYLDDWMIEHTSFCVTTKPVARYWVNWRLNTKKWDTLNKKKCWTKGSKRHLGWLVASLKRFPLLTTPSNSRNRQQKGNFCLRSFSQATNQCHQFLILVQYRQLGHLIHEFIFRHALGLATGGGSDSFDR